MRTTAKPTKYPKRILSLILLLVYLAIGVQGQKSSIYMNCYYIDSFKMFLRELQKNRPIGISLNYNLNLVYNEVNPEVNPFIKFLMINSETQSSNPSSNQNYDLFIEETDDAMEIEEWMLDKFEYNTRKSSLLLNDDAVEEEMEIEDWMLNANDWIVQN